MREFIKRILQLFLPCFPASLITQKIGDEAESVGDLQKLRQDFLQDKGRELSYVVFYTLPDGRGKGMVKLALANKERVYTFLQEICECIVKQAPAETAECAAVRQAMQENAKWN